MRVCRRVHFRTVQLLCLRHAFEQQHHGAPHGRHIDRLVGRIQDQHRLLHQRRTPHHNRVVDSTTGGTLCTGRGRPRRFRDFAPPGLKRFWPSCAHRASLGLDSSEPTAGCRAARATVSPITDLAPAPRNALAQASRVAPVVITSSTSKTRRLSTLLPGRAAKAPRTESHRSSKLRICLSVGASFAPTKLPGTAAPACEPAAWRLGPLGYNRAPAPFADEGVPVPPRLRLCLPGGQPPQAARQTSAPTVPHAQTSAARSPELAPLCRARSSEPDQNRTPALATRGRLSRL